MSSIKTLAASVTLMIPTALFGASHAEPMTYEQLLQEYPNLSAIQFQSLDDNNDGVLDEQEMDDLEELDEGDQEISD